MLFRYRGSEGMLAWAFHRISGVAIWAFILLHVLDIWLANVNATLYNDLLVVEGDRQPILGEKTSSCHQLGIKYGPFRSEVRLPFPVDQESVRAEYKNGLLVVTLKKATE